MIERVSVIEDGLCLPNDVSVLSDGSVIVADAGNDRICHFDRNGDFITSIGTKGFGEYRLKEPVALSVSPRDEIFVADWHNHRIIIYSKELSYLTEFGYYSVDDQAVDNSAVKRLLKFYRQLSVDGTYTRYFFSENEEQKTPAPVYSRLLLFIQGLYYWSIIRNDSIVDSIDRILTGESGLQKPNGVTFAKNKVYITQKNARCISIYERDYAENIFLNRENIRFPTTDEKFGRLGNLHASRFHEWIYICDEREGIIWILDHDGEYIGEVTQRDLGLSTFLPFCCVDFTESKIAVCSATELLIIDINNNEVDQRIPTNELHGITFDSSRDRMYVAERSSDRILSYRISA